MLRRKIVYSCENCINFDNDKFLQGSEFNSLSAISHQHRPYSSQELSPATASNEAIYEGIIYSHSDRTGRGERRGSDATTRAASTGRHFTRTP